MHEPVEGGLDSFPALAASITTELAIPSDVRYLAVWRLPAPGWERIVRLADPHRGYVYVPAFSLMRPVMQKLGASLCLNQPVLELNPGLPLQVRPRPALVGAPAESWATWEGPGFGAVSPVLIGRGDARVLAQFVQLAVESRETHDRIPTADELDLERGELVFLPAAWDPRYIHESNWRLLLSEFDDLVA